MQELQGWILGHSQEQSRVHLKKEERNQQRRRKTYQIPRKMKAAMKGDVNLQLNQHIHRYVVWGIIAGMALLPVAERLRRQ